VRQEGFGCGPDLAVVGHVLGVVDAHDRPGREAHGVIERAGLGPGAAIWNDDDFKAGVEIALPRGTKGVCIDRLDDELYVEPVSRVVDAVQGRNELGQHGCFME